MIAREPTPEQLEALRALHPSLYRLDASTGELVLIVVPPTRDAFEAYLEGFLDPATASDAEIAFALACAKWPSQAEVAAQLARRPALPAEVADELEAIAAGGYEMRALGQRGTPVEELDKPLFEDDGTPKKHPLAAQLEAEGLSAEALATLRAKMGPGRLVLVVTAAGVLVVATPSKSSYAAYRRAKRSGARGLAAAQHKLALDCVKHPKLEQLRGAIERWPVLPGLLVPHIDGLAGRGIEVTSTKL